MRWGRGVVLAVAASLALAGSTAGAPTPEHVHFTAAGDYSANTATTAGVLNALADGGSDAHFALGDLSYGATGAETTWCDFVKARVGDKFPFELLSGNHEANGQNGNINDFSSCLPNQLPGVVGTYGRQYYVDVPQVNPLVRFVMIAPNLVFPDGAWNYPAGSARYNWAAAAIDGARTAAIPWVVVGMHKPCLSLGEYGCDPGADVTNLLISKKVDLVLTGHEHLYQRTKQLALGAGCATLTIGTYNPSCVVDSDNALVKGAGTVFATLGTGGVSLRDVNLSDPEAGYFVATSGANQNPTYGFGDFDATPEALTVKFVRGAGGSFSDAFTLTRDATPPQNQKPTAAYTSSTSGLSATFNGSSSADPDGTISSWVWDFGDGGTGTGATPPEHTYVAAGTYPVKLTVTDNGGETDVVTHDVTVTSAPTSTLLASDDFDRTVTNGWGDADVGGSWSRPNTASRYSVGGSAGRLQVPATTAAELRAISSTSTRMTVEFSVDKLAEGTYVMLVGRQVGSVNYLVRLRLEADGGAKLQLMRGGSNTSLGTAYTPTHTFVPDGRYRMSLEVKGTSPTTVSAKVWKAADPEPGGWQRTVTDSLAGLQAPGFVGVSGYLGSGVPNSPVTISFHQLTVADAD